MAHITGGGLVDNVPRIIPEGLAACFDSGKWSVPPLFPLIQRLGNIDRDEMYHVFNMGIGMVAVCAPEDISHFTSKLPEIKVVGEVQKGVGDTRVVID